jgi:hypothetical protein
MTLGGVQQLTQRPVGRAALLLGSWLGRECVLLDIDSNDFVLAPEPPAGAEAAIGLSWDGTEILYVGLQERFGLAGLCRQNLWTGAVHWYRCSPREAVVTGAMSPGGRMIAMLTSDVTSSAVGVRVHVVDLSSGEQRELWSSNGGFCAESGIRWSPSGTLIAATYVDVLDDDDQEEWATDVFDLTGKVIASYPYCAVPPAPNGGWLNGDQLVLFNDFDECLQVCQPTQGTERRISLPWGGALAAAGLGFLCSDDHGGHAAMTLATMSVDGGSRKELPRVPHKAQLRVIDMSGALDLPGLSHDGPTGGRG